MKPIFFVLLFLLLVACDGSSSSDAGAGGGGSSSSSTGGSSSSSTGGSSSSSTGGSSSSFAGSSSSSGAAGCTSAACVRQDCLSRSNELAATCMNAICEPPHTTCLAACNTSDPFYCRQRCNDAQKACQAAPETVASCPPLSC